MSDLMRKVDQFIQDSKKKEWRVTVCASAVLLTSFYSLQMVFQRGLGAVRLHSGMPLQILAPVGLCATASSLYCSQIVEERVRRETYDYTFEPKHPLMKLLSRSESKKDKERRLLLGLGLYSLLERGLFKPAFPSSVIAIGVFGNAMNRLRYSVPATSELTTESQRAIIQSLGRKFGCHQCGDRQLARRVGFIADHMPPTRQALLQSQAWWRKLLGIKVQQRLWPQCQRCFLLQGSAVRANTHRLVYHTVLKSFHFAPVLALILMQQPEVSEKIKGVLDPCIEGIDKAVAAISKFVPPLPKI